MTCHEMWRTKCWVPWHHWKNPSMLSKSTKIPSVTSKIMCFLLLLSIYISSFPRYHLEWRYHSHRQDFRRGLGGAMRGKHCAGVQGVDTSPLSHPSPPPHSLPSSAIQHPALSQGDDEVVVVAVGLVQCLGSWCRRPHLGRGCLT